MKFNFICQIQIESRANMFFEFLTFWAPWSDSHSWTWDLRNQRPRPHASVRVVPCARANEPLGNPDCRSTPARHEYQHSIKPLHHSRQIVTSNNTALSPRSWTGTASGFQFSHTLRTRRLANRRNLRQLGLSGLSRQSARSLCCSSWGEQLAWQAGMSCWVALGTLTCQYHQTTHPHTAQSSHLPSDTCDSTTSSEYLRHHHKLSILATPPQAQHTCDTHHKLSILAVL